MRGEGAGRRGGAIGEEGCCAGFFWQGLVFEGEARGRGAGAGCSWWDGGVGEGYERVTWVGVGRGGLDEEEEGGVICKFCVEDFVG